MTLSKKPTLILILIFVVCVLLLGIFLFTTSKNTPPLISKTGVVHSVVLTNEGYTPKELTINLGDTVRFTTTQGRDFWPASDLHPTHGIYPDFDPQKPINVSTNWEFTFTRTGAWKYHDHLQPVFRGIIVVQ